MIEDVCTHLLVMQQGRAQYFGAANELRQRYPNTRTLEEAYFAATRGDLQEEYPSENDQDQDDRSAIPPVLISLDDYRSGAAL